MLAGDFVYPTIVSDNDTVIVVADAAKTTVEAPKQYVVSDGVYGRWTRKFENNKYVYYYNLYGLVDYRTDENIVITWSTENRNDLDVLEEMVGLLNDKIVEGALYTIVYTIDYDYDTKGNDVTRINLVEMTLADYWEDYDVYPFSCANFPGYGAISISLSMVGEALDFDPVKVKKIVIVDDMADGLLYDVGFEFDAKTGYLYVYSTEVGAKVSYDLKDSEPYYKIHEISYDGYDSVPVYLNPENDEYDFYVRYGHKLVIEELGKEETIDKNAAGDKHTGPFYTIGANPDKVINGKFYISKGAGEDVAIEFAMTGGKATVAYSPKVEEVPAVPSTANVPASSIAGEATEWLQDVYENNTITKKELYRYLVWDTSNYKDVSVSYQRIVPTIIPGTYGNGYKISYRFETVNVDSWDIISPYDYVSSRYTAIDRVGGTVKKTDLDTSYINYIKYNKEEEDGVVKVKSAEGVVYAYGKVENGTFIQYSKAEYDAQFEDNSNELKEDLKDNIDKLIRAYRIRFANGPVTLNVTNSNGKDVNVDLFFIKAYEKVDDDKYILIDYNKTIVAGSVEYTIKAKLKGGTEYVAPSDGTEFDKGEPAKCTVVITK